MRLLVVDKDRRLGELIRSVAERDNHQVWLAEDSAQALRLGVRCEPDLVVCSMDLGTEKGEEVLSTLMPRLAKRPDVLLTSGTLNRQDPRVQTALRRFQGLDLLRQPLSVLDLMDTVRRCAAAQQMPSPPPQQASSGGSKRRLRLRNVIQVARLWSQRMSGELVVDTPVYGRRRLVFVRGGIARLSDLSTLEEGLYQGSLQFVRRDVTGDSHWEVLGKRLWDAARDVDRPRFVQVNRFNAIVMSVEADIVAALPTSLMTQKVLKRADGTSMLGELLSAFPAREHAMIGGDLYALDRLRFITLQQPIIRNSRREEQRPAAVSPPVRTSVPRSSTSGMTSSITRAGRGRNAQMTAGQISRIIAHDIERMPSSTPARILMIEVTAGEPERKTAAMRLLRRYKDFARNPNISAEDRQHAENLRQLVAEAYRRLRNGDNRPIRGNKGLYTKEDLLREGIRYLQRSEWTEAYALLLRAHKMDSSDPTVLACLGWSRIHNPLLDLAEREREGLEEISLAYQLEPGNPETCFYLASAQLRMEQYNVVRLLIQGARTAHPSDTRFAALEKELNAAEADA